jgi:hypothetical protein
MLAYAAVLLHLLTHEAPSSSLVLDITMSFVPPAPSPSVKAPSPVIPVAAFSPAPATIDSSSSLVFLPSPPPEASLCPGEPFKLPEIKDAKAYLGLQDLIQNYLCLPEYSTKQLDNAVVTDASNLEASHFGEGQIRVALRVLFDRGSGIKIGETKLLQMPFLELYHVYIYTI